MTATRHDNLTRSSIKAAHVNIVPRGSCRRAFTIVELLVVIAIIGILVAILLPAVQSAREAGRRLQCSNNLKQIGLALHTYHEAHRSFPVNMTASGPQFSSGVWGTGLYSWYAYLLPYVEETPLHEMIDFDVNMADVGDNPFNPRIGASHRNAAAAATIVSMFLCPSDGYEITTLMGTAKSAPASYIANVGWPPHSTGIDGKRATPARHNGFIGLVHPAQHIDWHIGATSDRLFTDGLSNTIACAERLITRITKAAELEAATDQRTLSLCAGAAGSARTLGGYYQYTQYSHTDITHTKLTGRAWISGSTLVGNTFMPVMPINSFNAHFEDTSDGRNMITPSSQHPRGVNVLMGDGRVQFVAESIDMRVYWALGSRDGEEPVDYSF